MRGFQLAYRRVHKAEDRMTSAATLRTTVVNPTTSILDRRLGATRAIVDGSRAAALIWIMPFLDRH